MPLETAALRVLESLRDAGAGFEIASTTELDTLLNLRVPAREILYSNPIKSRANIAYALEHGVEWFVLDAVEELHKIFELAPEAKLCLRLFTPNDGAAYPLSGKFGAHELEAAQIIAEAARVGADLAGASYHVGSQCSRVENWRIGLRAARDAFDRMDSLMLSGVPRARRTRASRSSTSSPSPASRSSMMCSASSKRPMESRTSMRDFCAIAVFASA